jgi:predicted O-linked N-acetylglucosamine transferase (SPINDLY family)
MTENNMAFEHAKSLFLEALAAMQGKDYLKAEQFFIKSLNLLPNRPSTLVNLAAVQIKLNNYCDAKKNALQSVKVDDQSADGWLNYGLANYYESNLEQAIEAYDEALKININYADAWFNKGVILKDLKRFDEAHAAYLKALKSNPNLEGAYSDYVSTKVNMCDWSGLEQVIVACINSVEQHKPSINPFRLLGLVDDPELHLKNAKIYSSTLGVCGFGNARAANKEPINQKIKVGYFSADYHNHATSFLMAQMFETHSRNKFEFHAFSYGPKHDDDMRKRVSRAFDGFHEVAHISDVELVGLVRDIKIDIAVDLKGFTTGARGEIFAQKCAPIQVNYLGYPGTLGCESYDYIIADKNIIENQAYKFYTEKPVLMPESYQVNDAYRKVSVDKFNKAELSLPAAGFVYCCFNNNYKILPNIFDIWMRIIKSVEGSVLWLFEDNPFASRNLKLEAEKRGVDSSRLIFASKLPLDQHLARLRLADLFLDTLPYNAHTTASDALWAGLPLLTCPGKSFASRVAASLLHAVELPELVMDSLEAYEAKAIELAKDTSQLNAIKLKLEQNRKTSSLFDGKLFAQHLEMAYEAMFSRYQAGLAPDVIDVGELIQQKG